MYTDLFTLSYTTTAFNCLSSRVGDSIPQVAYVNIQRLLAAAEALSHGMYFHELMNELGIELRAELTVDSRSLQALSRSIREPAERRNKVDLASIRECYEEGSLNAIIWCPGQKLLADSLTKDNIDTARLMFDAISTGTHKRPAECAEHIKLSPLAQEDDNKKGGGGEI